MSCLRFFRLEIIWWKGYECQSQDWNQCSQQGMIIQLCLYRRKKTKTKHGTPYKSLLGFKKELHKLSERNTHWGLKNKDDTSALWSPSAAKFWKLAICSGGSKKTHWTSRYSPLGTHCALLRQATGLTKHYCYKLFSFIRT